ncbi:MAG: cellulase family glycosylhydrolase, partial [Bacteroidales bacterium]|nr:cellulase family glycosylhydrolase [Bacteroidales bacterium]
MKIKFYTFILVSIIWSFNSNLFSQNSAFNINQKLGRGVNLGNIFEGSFEGEWGITLNEKYFEIINEAGFNSVRIPIRWSSHADSLAPYAIDSVFMARIKWAINTALKNNLMAIINIHHYYDLFEKPEENKPRLLGIWNQISKEFKDYSDSLLFELCNEPNTNLTPSLWNAYAKEILDTVRVLNPKRTCIIGTAEWGGIGALPLLKLPGDTSIILTIHYYNPFQFTHQGADWVDGADAWLGSTWDSTISQQNAIINDLEKIKQYSDTANVPVFIGEFGSYSKADMDSRARWTAFCARKFEEYGFSWSYWEFASGFGFFDPGALVWRVELVKALTEMYPDSYLPLTGDTILLSDFSFGANWSLGLQGGALANIDNENEMYHITITNGGTANWHIQMIQNQIPIIYKTTYKVSFDAYSPDNLTINPYIGRNGDPWDSYSGANSISLTPSLQNYSFTFTKQEMTDLTARMAIDMGNQTGEVYFDNIIIEKIAKTNPVTS